MGPSSCSIRKLLHPYFLRYQKYVDGRFSDKNELLAFLAMVKLKEGKLKWALKQTNKKNEHLAFICGIKVRRFQQLKAEYGKTGILPGLVWNRRPKTHLTEDEKELINRAVRESFLGGAVSLRLYIDKYYHKKLPYGKIHRHLLASGMSKPDEKKKKQRKYCRYQRKYSFSLGHMDWHESSVIPGKWVAAWEDDAARGILAGGEFDHATTENAIKLVEEARKKALNTYSALLLALNTDKGSQFYANKKDRDNNKGVSAFEKYLKKVGIQHIPSRRNHPQTNGKEERWFRTYEENRHKFKTFEEFMNWYNNRIHLGLNRKEGITPNEAILHKLRPGSLLGLFLRMVEK